MPALLVRCPACKARFRVGTVAEGRRSVGCPRCGAEVPLRERVESAARKGPPQGPAETTNLWPILGGACLGGTVFVALVLLLVLGRGALPKPGPDQPAGAKNVALVVGLVVGGLLILNGINGIQEKRITGAEASYVTREYTGRKAVWIGAGQCVAGVLMTGGAIYGLLFG